MRKYLLFACVLWLLSCSAAFCLEVTTTELTELKTVFNNLSVLNKEQESILLKQNKELKLLNGELSELKIEIGRSKKQSEIAEQKLKEVNQLLVQLRKEQKAKDRQNRLLKYSLVAVGVYALSRR